MDQKAGAQISTRAFLQSLIILFVLMMVAGILTLVIPTGSYQYVDVEGRQMIEPGSFEFLESPNYPVWRWFTAPIEVLWGTDGLTIIIIIIFILMVGVSFAVMDKSGLLRAALSRIVESFKGRRYPLLLVISLFFMLMGAFFGIFEEVVPLVPVMLGLSYFLGWDTMVGLGMSILAVNMGFSAAITNPFTLGVAQNIAGLPLFSGAWFRVIIFIAIYAVFAFFLVRYARKIDADPKASPVYEEDKLARSKYTDFNLESLSDKSPEQLRRASTWLLVFIVLILLLLVSGPFIPALSSFSLPLVGLMFFIGGIGAGILAGEPRQDVFRAVKDGFTGIAPAIPLILMASSVKHIVSQGGILDTILFQASHLFSETNPFLAVVLIYFLALLIEFFIASGSAKAFLIIPIIVPLADLVGITRQLTVTAYCFGDGFSNMIYPTNPVLLICLGLTVVSYPKWLKWSLKLWLWVLLLTLVFLGLGVVIGYGPF